MRLSLLGLALLLLVAVPCLAERSEHANEGIDPVLVLMTWNVRGYPESTKVKRKLFSTATCCIDAHILCIQEIKDTGVVNAFVANEAGFTQQAFTDDPSEGKDNAIFASSDVYMDNGRVGDPVGFQFRPRAVYVAYRGFDAVLITVHLAFGDEVCDPGSPEMWRCVEKVASQEAISDVSFLLGLTWKDSSQSREDPQLVLL